MSTVDKHHLNISKQLLENKVLFTKLQNGNKYYASLIESILKHDKTFDIVNLSK